MKCSQFSFEVWKQHLQEDCARKDKLDAFMSLGDYVLHFLWERGLQPTVQSIVNDRVDAA